MEKYLDKIRGRMEAMLDKRTGELAMVQAKREAACKAAEKAEADLATAVEAMDEPGYVKASQDAQSARAALEMYGKHHEQLAKRELIPEADSDAVIDELLDYEKALGEKFIRAITGPLSQLERLCADYHSGIKEAEGVLEDWQARIHANYRSVGTLFRDEAGNVTSRSSRPVPVHKAEFTGCPEATQVRTFLDKILPRVQAAFTEES